jgi:NAD(P)-dependent dehydrogenase (short-subunit alcohol dehydrogenase family)
VVALRPDLLARLLYGTVHICNHLPGEVTGSTTTTRPDPGLEVYGASKAAVRNLVRSWALSSKARNFRVNALSPGPTKTPGLLSTARDDPQAKLDRTADGGYAQV